MPLIEKDEVAIAFRRFARNSSHFVWLIAPELRFFRASNGWIFAFEKRGEVTLLPLEPLIPLPHTESTADLMQGFSPAWDEFSRELKVGIAAFVSVYAPFRKILEANGFRSLKVGQEPWVELRDCIPKGNAGKGVRSARNQALHAGLSVEEWPAAQLEASPEKRRTLERLYRAWKASRLVHLGGFLNACDPFSYARDRRYFVLRSARCASGPGKVKACLVAVPVAGAGGYFLEDLVMAPGAPRGAGELLTLEAMVALRDSLPAPDAAEASLPAACASLGVVSMTTLEAAPRDKGVPKVVKFLMVSVPRYFRAFYNFDGLETYRKRFKPHRWESVYFAVKNDGRRSDSSAWLMSLAALFGAFRPRLQPSFDWLGRTLSAPFKRYPLAFFMLALNTGLFAAINRFGELPNWARDRFAFSAEAPVSQWVMRSVVSDWLYFDHAHFLVWGLGYCAAVAWAERSHRYRFLVPFIALVSVFDDLVNYWVLVKPFAHFQPPLFRALIAFKDVGSSLGLATLLGLQICQFRRLREPLFAVTSIALVLAFAFTSVQMQFFVTNLNHVLFFVIGFLIGKLKFESGRRTSRLAAKGKPPEARCVAPLSGSGPGPDRERRKAA